MNVRTISKHRGLIRSLWFSYSNPTSPANSPSNNFGRGTKGSAWDISFLLSPPSLPNKSLARAVVDEACWSCWGAKACAKDREEARARVVENFMVMDVYRRKRSSVVWCNDQWPYGWSKQNNSIKENHGNQATASTISSSSHLTSSSSCHFIHPPSPTTNRLLSEPAHRFETWQTGQPGKRSILSVCCLIHVCCYDNDVLSSRETLTIFAEKHAGN